MIRFASEDVPDLGVRLPVMTMNLFGLGPTSGVGRRVFEMSDGSPFMQHQVDSYKAVVHGTESKVGTCALQIPSNDEVSFLHPGLCNWARGQTLHQILSSPHLNTLLAADRYVQPAGPGSQVGMCFYLSSWDYTQAFEDLMSRGAVQLLECAGVQKEHAKYITALTALGVCTLSDLTAIKQKESSWQLLLVQLLATAQIIYSATQSQAAMKFNDPATLCREFDDRFQASKNSGLQCLECTLSAIAKYNPDLVSLQEVTPAMRQQLDQRLTDYSRVSPPVEQGLDTYLYYKTECFSSEDDDQEDPFRSILQPMIAGNKKNLPLKANWTVRLVHRFTGQIVAVVPVHLSSDGSQCVPAIQTLQQMSDNYQNSEVLIAIGDFNNTAKTTDTFATACEAAYSVTVTPPPLEFITSAKCRAYSVQTKKVALPVKKWSDGVASNTHVAGFDIFVGDTASQAGTLLPTPDWPMDHKGVFVTLLI